jgi:hypothetical protein
MAHCRITSYPKAFGNAVLGSHRVIWRVLITSLPKAFSRHIKVMWFHDRFTKIM